MLDFLDTDTGKDFIQKSSDEVNESPEKVKSVLGMGVPMITGAIKKNTNSPEGLEKLDSELAKDKHNGSILDKIGSGGLNGILGGFFKD